jgi:hypothetical protein
MVTATDIELAELEREADRARWEQMLARGRVLQPLLEAMLSMPGTTIEDVQLTLRAWADALGARAEEPVPQIEDIPP